MTRKDYERIAGALRWARLGFENPDTLQGVDEAAEQIAKVLAQDNPRFDRERFLKAAGMAS